MCECADLLIKNEAEKHEKRHQHISKSAHQQIPSHLLFVATYVFHRILIVGSASINNSPTFPIRNCFA
jgi:hypothetical protein